MPTTYVIPTQSPSPTPIPTLLSEQREPYIFNLIKTNGDCLLPCFWGITPGITSWDTTLQLLQYIGARYSSDIREDGNHIFTGFDLQNNIPVSIEFVERDNTVESIWVGIGKINLLQWEPYLLSTILNTYGLPSKVLLNIPQPVEPPVISTGYDLWLTYEELGVLIAYRGANIRIQPKMQICPNSKNRGEIEGLVLFLQEGSANTWPEIITTSMSGARELETVSNLSIDDFYRVFKDETATDCIESDSSNW